MQIIRYVCDRCGRDLKERYQLHVYGYGEEKKDSRDSEKWISVRHARRRSFVLPA